MARDLTLYLGMVTGISSFMIGAFQQYRKSNNFALFSVAFYSNQTPMAVVGLDKKVMYANPALERLLGYSENELRKMEFTKFTHPDDIDGDVELFNQLVNGERDRYQFRKKWIPKMAEGYVSGILSCSLVMDMEKGDGSIFGIFAMITPLDGTDARIEKAVERSLKKMEKDNSGKDGIIEKVVDGLTKMDKLDKPLKMVFLFVLLASTIYMVWFGGFEDMFDKIYEIIKLIVEN